MRNAPCLIECSNKIHISIGKIACTVRMFCHGEMRLLPCARRIVQHRDGTRRGNSSFPFHFVFCIGSIVVQVCCNGRQASTMPDQEVQFMWALAEIYPSTVTNGINMSFNDKDHNEDGVLFRTENCCVFTPSLCQDVALPLLQQRIVRNNDETG